MSFDEVRMLLMSLVGRVIHGMHGNCEEGVTWYLLSYIRRGKISIDRPAQGNQTPSSPPLNDHPAQGIPTPSSPLNGEIFGASEPYTSVR